MLKHFSIFFQVVLVLIAFSGCKKDKGTSQSTEPTITITPNFDLSLERGDTANYTIQIGANERLSSFYIKPDKPVGDSSFYFDTLFKSDIYFTTINYSYPSDTTNYIIGDSIKIIFSVTDKLKRYTNATGKIIITTNN